MLRFVILGVAGLTLAPARAQDDPDGRPLRLDVALDLGGGTLDPASVKFAVFPSGKRCAFTYTGPTNPRTIGFMSKLGFRTTVYVGPGTPAERVRALEEAGAEVGIGGYWGAQGDYHSLIGQNSVQEAFDAVVTSVLDLRRKARGPVACGAIGGHIDIARFPLNRDMDSPDGYGAVFQDSNLLLLLDNKPYAVYLGRRQPKALVTRDKNDNVVETRNVPNELVYYQILAGQFQGTLKRASKGQIVRYSLRDFKADDLEELKDVVGDYGTHPRIWHATEGEIGAYEYAVSQAKVAAVRGSTVSLELPRDVFPAHLLAPLCLELPRGTPVKAARLGGIDCAVTSNDDGVFVDVPLGPALRDGVEMSFAAAAPDLTVPDETGVTLVVKNVSGKALEQATVEWVAGPGLAVTPAPGGPFRADPGGEVRLPAVAKTERGARWGLSPAVAIVRGTLGGEPRVFSSGFEIKVAPRLRVEMDPMSRLPLPAGRSQHFVVRLANGRAGKPGGPEDKFLSHKAGPCRGVATLDLPAGMTADPPERRFEMAENGAVTLAFLVTNREWGREPAKIRPLVRFEGENEPAEVLCPGTTVIRDPALVDYAPLDETGLLVYAGWDDREKAGGFDRSAGSPHAYYYPGHQPGYSNEGVKGWCLEVARSCQIYSTVKNIDAHEGTMCFWFRRDPKVRNELQVKGDPAQSWKQGVNRGNDGESMIVVGNVQRRSYSQGGMVLRRFPGWDGKDGYLELVYQGLGRRLHHVTVPYEKATMFQWRHIALVWSARQKRLELYLDGKLAGKADPDEAEWYPVPWDNGGRAAGHPLEILTTDHGHWSGTCRDELYIYNRALSADEIRANLGRAGKAP
jgi:hypothetical protein